VELALERVEQRIAESGPFDALLAFSQGTIVATMLTAIATRRWNEVYLSFSCPERQPRSHLNSYIAVSTRSPIRLNTTFISQHET